MSLAIGKTDIRRIEPFNADQGSYELTGLGRHGFNQQRKSTASYAASVASITQLHTETLNIWSHLLGALWFLSSLVHFAATSGGPTTSKDAVAIWAYLTTTTLCFTSSTLYHLFANHRHAGLWQLFDHLAIIASIWASSASFSILSSDMPSKEKWMFITLLSAAAMASLRRMLRIRSHDQCARQIRIGTHLALGVLAAMPALRAWVQRADDHQVELLADFAWLLLVNSAGGSIYASHLLDKSVGMDIGLPDLSHHVMHVMVIVGASIYKQGILSLYRERTV